MKSLTLFAGAAAAVLALTVPVSAQWARHTPPGTPKNAEGKPDLTAPTPRMPDGKPDLLQQAEGMEVSSIWRRRCRYQIPVARRHGKG